MKVFILVVILFLYSLPNHSQNSQFEVMTESMPPFAYKKNNQLMGVSVDIVRELLKRVGHSDSIKIYPWARAYDSITSEPNKILFSMVRSREREDLFEWVGPIIVDQTFFYKKRGSNLVISELDDARTVKSIAVSRGFAEQYYLERKGFTNLYLTVKPTKNFKMVHGNRAELTVSGELIIADTLRELNLPINALEKTSVKVLDAELYLAFSKGTPKDIIHKWQLELDKFKKTEQYQNMKSKYSIN